MKEVLEVRIVETQVENSRRNGYRRAFKIVRADNGMCIVQPYSLTKKAAMSHVRYHKDDWRLVP